MLAELIFTAMRRRPISIGDFSAVVTGLILAFSLPPTAPWYVGVVGSFVAIGIGKAVFGGLGQNIFNPAMVGRAFVMVCFASLMGASAYVDPHSTVDVVTAGHAAFGRAADGPRRRPAVVDAAAAFSGQHQRLAGRDQRPGLHPGRAVPVPPADGLVGDPRRRPS